METITTFPRLLSNTITYEDHQKYIMNKTFKETKTIKHISTTAKKLDDYQINELIDLSCSVADGLYKIPIRSGFVSRQCAYDYIKDNIVYYSSEVEYE